MFWNYKDFYDWAQGRSADPAGRAPQAATPTWESDIRDVEPKTLETIRVTTTELQSAANCKHERLEEIRISELEDKANVLVSDNDGRDENEKMLQNCLPELENNCKRKTWYIVGEPQIVSVPKVLSELTL